MHNVGDFGRDTTLKDNHSPFVHFELNKNAQKCPQVIPVCITKDGVAEHPTELWLSLCWQLLSLVMRTGSGEKMLVPSFNSVVFASSTWHTVIKKIKLPLKGSAKC